MNRVAEALKAIRRKCSIQEAYIIGSLLVQYRWNRSSDIDVAVGGCSGAVLEVMKALGDATGKVVNVIDLDYHPFPNPFDRISLDERYIYPRYLGSGR